MPTTETFVCAECGKTFSTSAALGGHRWRAHGLRGDSERTQARQRAKATALDSPGGVVDQVRAHLLDLLQPVRDQLAEINARLEQVTAETRELQQARRELVAVLGKIDPAEASKNKAKGTQDRKNLSDSNARRGKEQLAVKVDAVAAILTGDPDTWADGFTSNQLAAELTPRVPRGLSTKTARQVLEILRDRGIVRHDRVVKGGGMQFKLMVSDNGSSGHE